METKKLTPAFITVKATGGMAVRNADWSALQRNQWETLVIGNPSKDLAELGKFRH